MPFGQLAGDDRLRLAEMLSKTGAENHTEEIRSRRHSQPLRADSRRLRALLKTGASIATARDECEFMALRYPEVLSRLMSGEMDLRLFDNLIDCLADIENGVVDQHEASAVVGNALKELYVDGAKKKKDEQVDTRKDAARNISYKEYLAARSGD